jgi:leader peptidase (prepilin peptidase) / N-methyltransferase
MNVAIAAVVFAPALAIGSFLNVVTSRLPAGLSVVTPRSRCSHCGAQIRSIDNIPLLSYALLRGRCRDCKAPIGIRYPAVELVTAALVVACVIAFGPSVQALAAAVFCVALVAISITDLERMIVPNVIVLPATAIVLALQMVWHPSLEWVIAGLGASLFFFLAALAYPRGLGMGDVKLALLLGVGVGRSVPWAIMIGTAAALVPSIVLFARHGMAARKRKLPFAPFLALGGLVALFAGGPLVDWYLGFIR